MLRKHQAEIGCGFALIAALTVASALAQSEERARTSGVVGRANDASPIYGVTLPPGYRDWPLISVAQLGGDVDDLRAKLGNDAAMQAFREGKRPFADGTIIVRLAFRREKSASSDVLRGDIDRLGLSEARAATFLEETFVAGAPTNVQLMVKDSTKYASTGGWGFAQFTDGVPDDEAVHATCFSCHAPARANDFVFTSYAF